MTRLRSAFAEAVRSGDFAASLHIGERICRLFPDSSLALEYLSIREQLLRRQAAHSDREPIEAAPFA